MDLKDRGYFQGDPVFKNPLAKANPAIPKDSEVTPKALPQNTANFQKALEIAKSLKSDGKTKADIARAIFPLVENESKEVVLLVLVQGCGLTPKGAVTYRYNLLRANSKLNLA